MVGDSCGFGWKISHGAFGATVNLRLAFFGSLFSGTIRSKTELAEFASLNSASS